MENIIVFRNEELNVTIEGQLINGRPMFIANDVASMFGFVQPSTAIRNHCKGMLHHGTLKRGGYPVKMIPEGDIIRLAMKSPLPKAEKFESWVCDEVIPTVLKHGAYISEDADIDYVKNEIKFSKKRTINTFANCKPSEVEDLYSEFRTYIDKEFKYSYQSKERIARYKSVEKGLRKLIENTVEEKGVMNGIGSCYDVLAFSKQVLIDRTNLEKRVNGGKKAGLTKKLKKISNISK